MSDDLRVRVAQVLCRDAIHNRDVLDRAIAIVWNEAIEAAEEPFDEFFALRLRDLNVGYVPPDLDDSDLHKLLDAIRALRKPGEGG